jgi:hypothetical protein
MAYAKFEPIIGERREKINFIHTTCNI